MGLQEDIIEKEKNRREGGSERRMAETSSMDEVIQRTVFIFVMCTLTLAIPSSNYLVEMFSFLGCTRIYIMFL